MNALIQLGGSLVAILMLAGVAWALRLGGARTLDPAQALSEAEAILSGFDGDRAVVASDGRAALVHGRDGSAALLKVHGNKVAGRRLNPPIATRSTADGLVVASGEARFGSVLLRGVSSL